MNSKKDIGERIALLRRKRNQKILAIKAFKEKTPGAAQKKWSEIKTGKQDATIVDLEAIAKALGCRLDDLIKLDGVNKNESESCNVECSPTEREYGEKAVKVLRSKTGYADSLRMNIDSFYESVNANEAHEYKLSKVQEENQKIIDTYKIEIELLKEEVRLLKEGINKKHPEPKKSKGSKNLTSPIQSGNGEDEKK
ncbi:MAG: hypothetical protein A4E53_00630 [Pelotomaculum sp. PtaB.Bin104]|nr:MAG: hypothetical protein A4E53_00630 [Pelotomaculum sp. PtaB.Bin104]